MAGEHSTSTEPSKPTQSRWRNERGASETLVVLLVASLFVVVVTLMNAYFTEGETRVANVVAGPTVEGEIAEFYPTDLDDDRGCFQGNSIRQVVSSVVGLAPVAGQAPDEEPTHQVDVSPAIDEMAWGMDVDRQGGLTGSVSSFTVPTRDSFGAPPVESDSWIVAKNPVRLCWDLMSTTQPNNG